MVLWIWQGREAGQAGVSAGRGLCLVRVEQGDGRGRLAQRKVLIENNLPEIARHGIPRLARSPGLLVFEKSVKFLKKLNMKLAYEPAILP